MVAQHLCERVRHATLSASALAQDQGEDVFTCSDIAAVVAEHAVRRPWFVVDGFNPKAGCTVRAKRRGARLRIKGCHGYGPRTGLELPHGNVTLAFLQVRSWVLKIG